MYETVRDWVPVLLRIPVVVVLSVPAINKFSQYSQQVELFGSIGIPSPELMVGIVGVIEVAAVILIALGVAGRTAAAVMIPVMLTAMATAGVAVPNVIVLMGCVGIVALGTGRYSVMSDQALLASIQGSTGQSSGANASGEQGD